MISDLEKSCSNAQANFLVALGIFNYIEILGSFYYYDNSRGNCTKRFNFVFNNILNRTYKNFFAKLNRITSNGSYDCLRCGMSHEYLVKTYRVKTDAVKINFTIYGVNNPIEYRVVVQQSLCGLELVKLGNNHYHLRVNNAKLIHDLDCGFEEYKRRLSSGSKGYRDRFVKRCQSVGLEQI